MPDDSLEQEFISNQQKIEDLKAAYDSRINLESAIADQRAYLSALEQRLAPPPQNLGERLLHEMKKQPRVDPGSRRIGFNIMKTPTLAELRRNN